MSLQKPTPNPLQVSEQSPLVLTTLNAMATAFIAAIVDAMVNVNLASLIAGENLALSKLEVVQVWNATVISVSTLIKPTNGVFGGFHVLATGGSATVTVYDGEDDTGTAIWTRVVVAGEYVPDEVNCRTAIYVKIADDTATLRVNSI